LRREHAGSDGYREPAEEQPSLAQYVGGAVSHTLIAAIGIAYVCIAVEQGLKQSWGVSVMFIGYAIGQVGVWMQAK
jgi:hypothetical protein